MDIIIIKRIVFLVFFILFFMQDLLSLRLNKKLLAIFVLIGIFVCVLDILFDFNTSNIYNTVYALIPGIILLILSKITRGQVGSGDAIFFVGAGLYLNIAQVVFIVMTGLLTVVIVGIFKKLAFSTKRSIRKSVIPFIPCLLPGILYILISSF